MRLRMRDLLQEGEPAAAGGGTPPAPPPPPPAEDPEIGRMRTQLANKEQENQRLNRELVNRPPAAPAPGNTPADIKKQVEQQLWKNPVETVQALATMAAQTVMAQHQEASFPTLRDAAREKVRGNNKERFDKYASEIDALVGQADKQFQLNPNVWENAYFNVIGRHASDLVEDAASRRGGNPRPSADGPGVPSAAAPRATSAAAALSADELKMAKNLGLTADQYAHGKEVYENQGTGKGDAPSSWDPVVTTDSRVRAREKRDRERQRQERK